MSDLKRKPGPSTLQPNDAASENHSVVAAADLERARNIVERLKQERSGLWREMTLNCRSAFMYDLTCQLGNPEAFIQGRAQYFMKHLRDELRWGFAPEPSGSVAIQNPPPKPDPAEVARQRSAMHLLEDAKRQLDKLTQQLSAVLPDFQRQLAELEKQRLEEKQALELQARRRAQASQERAMKKPLRLSQLRQALRKCFEVEIAESTLRRWAEQGRIPGAKLRQHGDGHWRVPVSAKLCRWAALLHYRDELRYWRQAFEESRKLSPYVAACAVQQGEDIPRNLLQDPRFTQLPIAFLDPHVLKQSATNPVLAKIAAHMNALKARGEYDQMTAKAVAKALGIPRSTFFDKRKGYNEEVKKFRRSLKEAAVVRKDPRAEKLNPKDVLQETSTEEDESDSSCLVAGSGKDKSRRRGGSSGSAHRLNDMVRVVIECSETEAAGFCKGLEPDDKKALRAALESRGYTSERLRRLGLVSGLKATPAKPPAEVI